ncbi:hypothetical protein CBR_g4116 [Chara braunii]|uniref:Uncharacterized protein n=1 Tax=Chara braunii TaxID=69332 RepID=A0A388KHA0_CHABU|nr:hypothetical protein CBR_g4116 [Chara braunii]|eukprot:GBG69422.1 hypothetical protein CBR_g4116 [Chara braunii]
MMQSMLDIIWELEEEPTPSLEEFVDWHQADSLMHRCYGIFRNGQDRCAALEAGLSPATTIEDNRGSNSFNTNMDCNDSNDNDNNNDNNINNNNNNNNNNNELTIINYNSLGVLNDNCGGDIASRGIVVGGGENINENGGNDDNIFNNNNENNNNNINNNNNNNDNNNNKQLKNIDHSFLADDNCGDEIDGKRLVHDNCGNEIVGQRIDDNTGVIGIDGAIAGWQRMGVG